MSVSQRYTTVPHDFESVVLDTYDECPCSPALDDDFCGLRIHCPTTIALGEPARFPLCGVYQMVARAYVQFTSLSNELTLVAVSAETHSPYIGNLLSEDHQPRPPSFDPNDPELDEVTLTGWFNVDLFRVARGMPRRAGRYYVFATVGPMTSNVATVTLVSP